MTSTKTAADVVRALRVGIDMDDQQETQIMYEGALKDESWVLRAQAVPLIVGCAPADWQQYLLAQDIVPQEEILWHALANDLGVAENAEIEIGRLVEWARVQSIPLHPSFLRIYDFVRKVLLASVPASNAGDDDQQLRDIVTQEREIVLGAALSLVAKMPDKCRDEHGFVDGRTIVGLMEQASARWFPQGEPSMDAEEMARLIDKWLE